MAGKPKKKSKNLMVCLIILGVVIAAVCLVQFCLMPWVSATLKEMVCYL